MREKIELMVKSNETKVAKTMEAKIILADKRAQEKQERCNSGGGATQGGH